MDEIGTSLSARNARPASVIRHPPDERRTMPWLKMSSPGVRDAMRLVRSVQSGPLEMRIATLLRNSATDRYPSGCPAKTFKMVTWNLTVAAARIDREAL